MIKRLILILSLMILCAGTASGETADAVLMHNGADRFQKAILRPDGSALMVGAIAGGVTEDDLALPTMAWAMRLDSKYRELWLNGYGGSGDDALWDALPLPDGTWLAVGEASSPDGDVEGWHEGYYDAFQNKCDGWIVRLADDGAMLWNRCYGGSQWDRLTALCARPDGNFLAVGSTASPDGDLEGLYVDPVGNEHSDAWILCFSAEGEFIWQRTLGAPTTDDSFYAIAPMQNGGYLIAGKTRVDDRAEDGWLVAIDEAGDVLWERTYGGIWSDGLSAMCQTPDGGFFVVGFTESDGDGVPELTHYADCSGWALRLSPEGSLMWQLRIVAGENSALSAVVYDHDGFMMAGESIWADTWEHEGWALSLDANGEPRWSNNIELTEVFVTRLDGE